METRKLKKGQLIIAKCDKIVPEGLGLSYLIDKQFSYPIKPHIGFVWGVLPGEIFVAEVRKISSKCFHAVLIEKNKISDEINTKIQQLYTENFVWEHHKWAVTHLNIQRQEPACDNFVLCGGCKLQHLSYQDTLALKLAWLNELLYTIPEHNIKTIITESPKQFHYRNNVQVHINKYMERGFFSPMTYRTIAFPKSGCHIFDQNLFDTNFPDELKLERCVRSRIDENTSNAKIWALYSQADKTDNFTYTIQYPKNTATNIHLPNLSFFQVNTSFIPIWLEKITNLIPKELISKNEPLRILELFSGFGFISKMLSYTIPLVSTGIDILDKVHVEKVTMNNSHLKSEAIENFNNTFIKHDLTKLNSISNENIDYLQKFNADLIVINPPRAGFDPNQIDFFYQSILNNKKIPIIYSSCDASTMIRDIKKFIELGYTINHLEALDFFPWTSHYEVLGYLY